MASTRISRSPSGTLTRVKRPPVAVRVPTFVPPIVTSAPAIASPVTAFLTAPSIVPVCAARSRTPSDGPSMIATAIRGRTVLSGQHDERQGIGPAPIGSWVGNVIGGDRCQGVRPGGFEPPTNSLEGKREAPPNATGRQQAPFYCIIEERHSGKS